MYNVSKKHCYALENKHQIIPEMDDLERSGRPPKVTPILERRIVRETMKNPFDSSLKMVKNINLGLMEEQKISARTLRRYTTLNCMKCYRPAINTQLTPKQILERRQFAKKLSSKRPEILG